MALSTWNAVTAGASGVQAPDGTVAAPAMAFASEPATGRYRVGANNIGEAIGGAADGSFEISANLNVSAITVLTTTLTCTYTDESNTARTLILPIAQIAGSFIAAGAITALGVWQTPVLHIRAKAATTITILSSTGTFTGVTYTAEALIKWTA